jgi:acyl-CoA synthetase (NDP forming)
VTNSEALSALAADGCASWGLEVVHGPVAVPSEATAAQFRAALTDAFGDDDVDAVVTGFMPPLVTLDREVAVALAEVAAASEKTCVTTLLGMHGVTEALSSSTRTVPAYPTPEDAVRALASANRYAEWRRRDRGAVVTVPGLLRDRARALVERLTPPEADGVWLEQSDAATLLAAYGIELWPEYHVSTPDEAAAAADRVGYPVALKATAAHLRHRADLGAVRLDIGSEEELRSDLRQMAAALGCTGPGTFAVQAMAPAGVACVVRSTEDPLFGPVVEFGVGGPPTELLGDVARRTPPLREGDLADLVRSIAAAPLLFGHRGAEPVDIEALEDVVARVSLLADDLPEVADLELNPVVAFPKGAAVLGARVRLAVPPGRTDADTRRLPG